MEDQWSRTALNGWMELKFIGVGAILSDDIEIVFDQSLIDRIGDQIAKGNGLTIYFILRIAMLRPRNSIKLIRKI